MDTLLCRYLYWYQHNSITGILFLPLAPRGGESEPSLYVESLNRGAPGADYLPQTLTMVVPLQIIDRHRDP